MDGRKNDEIVVDFVICIMGKKPKAKVKCCRVLLLIFFLIDFYYYIIVFHPATR